MPMPARIVFASGNPGKLREVARLLADYAVTVVPQSELGVSEADETGDTFTANSLIKSAHAAAVTGLPAIADDSGLVVDALDGAPGVYSARYAGANASDDDNIDKLLAALDGVAASERTAHFACVASFVDPDSDEPLVAEGKWQGRILEARQGDGGFGYDPVFLDRSTNRAAAELDPTEKNARSHRGHALRALIALLEARYGPE